ncbi:ClpP/crotonase-like domain-containing protein [Powellomyces hirtus]|nr:ClpP/crotonase-like domain-containing protein [Powellomyces hirtus]
MHITSALLPLLGAAALVSAQAPATRRYGVLKDVRPELGFANYSPAQKVQVADQVAQTLQVFAHQYVKIDNYGVNAQKEIAEFQKKAATLSHRDYHYGLARLFLSLRDFHTNYYIPGAHSCYGFVTPFQFDFVESKDIVNDPRIIVKSLTINPDIVNKAGKAKVALVQPGDVLTKIDGISFKEHWKRTQKETGGANQFGGYRAALSLLSSRNGKLYPAPENDEINFTFQRAGVAQPFNVTIPWVTVGNKACLADAPGGGQAFTKQLFHGPNVNKKSKTLDAVKPDSPLDGVELFPNAYADVVLTPTKSTIVHWAIYKHNGANLGILRLDAFTESGQPDTTLAETEFRNLLLNELAETDSLLIDIRDNGGGSLNLADGLPQLFVPDYQPGLGRALISNNNRVIFVNNTQGGPDWKAAFEAAKPGDKYSKPIPFNSVEQTNELGQIYLKPVGIFTDANCYSACDTFAAAMQDNSGAIIYGEDGTTGAGGANVIQHRANLIPMAPTIYKPLPYQDVDANGAIRLGAPDFRISWRATMRVKKNNGQLIEDRGVLTDRVIRPRTEDFTVNQATGKSTQFERIAKELKRNGELTRKNGRFFQSPLNLTRAVTGAKLSFPYTSQWIKSLEIRDGTNKVVGKASPSPHFRRTSGTIQSSATITTLGRFKFTIFGFDESKKQILKTKRDVIVTPGTDKFLKVAAGQTWNFAKSASSAFSAVYNTVATPAANGWQVGETSLVVGDGKQYLDNVNSAFSIFANVPAGAKLATAFDFLTEADYDYFTISVRPIAAAAPTILFVQSGKGTVETAYDLPAGDVEIQFLFTSDGGVTDRGAVVSKIAIQA